MNTAKRKGFQYLLGWIALIRLQNIVILIGAQYLAAIYIFSGHKWLGQTLTDLKLAALIFASALTVVAGYLVNSLCDQGKNLINKPLKTNMEIQISQHQRWLWYIILNALALAFSWLVSFRAMCFFAVYMAAIVAYAYAIKKTLIWSNVMVSALTTAPFLAVFLYYKNSYWLLFPSAFFLYLLVLLKSFVGDMHSIVGDFASNYKTLPIVYGERTAKQGMAALAFLIVVLAICIPLAFDLKLMRYYFYGCAILIGVADCLLFRMRKKVHYLIFYNFLKALIVLGVLWFLATPLLKNIGYMAGGV